MNLWLWGAVGLVSSWLTHALWSRSRAGRSVSLVDVLLSFGAGYLAVEYGGDLTSNGALGTGVAAVLAVHAASPLIAWWFFARGGAVRRKTLRLLFLGLIFFVSFVIGVGGLEFGARESVLCALAVTCGVGWLAPWVAKFGRRDLQRFHHWRQRRQHLRLEERRLRLDEQVLRDTQQRARRAEQQLQQTEQELTKLRQREAAETERLARRRRETLDQVHAARAWEREQSGAHGGMAVHPSPYGFLLLEASRVLRAEIAAGERIPPLESDQFRFEIVERLLSDPDFEARYLHMAGEQAALLLHRHLRRAEIPLSVVETAFEKLDLDRRHLAPAPLPSPLLPALLAAWLEPHRRFQEQQRQRYRASQHPHQAVISDFLRSRCSGIPESSTWRTYWDESPAVFVHGQNEPTTPSRPRSMSTGSLPPSRSSAGRVRRWIAAWSSDTRL